MNTYELMLIFNPQTGESEVKTQLEAVKSKISEFGGTVKNEDFWGLKDLAYVMNKFKQAYYVVLILELDTLKVKDLSDYINRQQTQVIRQMITTVNN